MQNGDAAVPLPTHLRGRQPILTIPVKRNGTDSFGKPLGMCGTIPTRRQSQGPCGGTRYIGGHKDRIHQGDPRGKGVVGGGANYRPPSAETIMGSELNEGSYHRPKQYIPVQKPENVHMGGFSERLRKPY